MDDGRATDRTRQGHRAVEGGQARGNSLQAGARAGVGAAPAVVADLAAGPSPWRITARLVYAVRAPDERTAEGPCAAAVEVSDNPAANLLLPLLNLQQSVALHRSAFSGQGVFQLAQARGLGLDVGLRLGSTEIVL